MKIIQYSLLSSLFSVSAYSIDLDLGVNGGGLETLMGGVGVARIGSNGALQSNPSLFAWLPPKKEFISTNSVTFYKFRDTSFNISPQVVPIYAISTEGAEEWGHGYGLTSSALSVKAKNRDNKSDVKQSSLAFNYGAGKKISENQAIGFALGVSRYSEELTAESAGSDSGADYLASIQRSESVWALSANLGYSQVINDDWSVGINTRQGLAKFAHRSREDATFLNTALPGVQKTTNYNKSRVNLSSNSSIGLQKRFETFKWFLDFVYTQPFTNSDGNRTGAANAFKSGVEVPLGDHTYKIYGGLGYGMKTQVEKEPDTDPFGSVQTGFSRKGKHSLTYAGISYTAPFSSEGYAFTAIFGTKFEY